tara:strand:- start:356 stop:619 length:264 start_codon:yes stop_codon:yes gene_type:complete
MTTSYIKERQAELKKQKQEERLKEITERAKAQAVEEEKRIANELRIQKKMVRISGLETGMENDEEPVVETKKPKKKTVTKKKTKLKK